MLLKIIKKIALIALIVVVLIGGYFAFMTITDYQPDEVIALKQDTISERTIDPNESFKITTFNIGYATLDKNADFFMDGGTESKAESEDVVYKNLEGITSFYNETNSDFYLMQEVDIKALRSKNINEYDYLSDYLDNYESTFATNYKVPWVPVPIMSPMGYVESGIVNFSKYQSNELNRYQFPGEEAWPRQLALLDRCFIEARYKITDEKDLVIVNLHMSAYDSGGFMRAQQVEYLQNFLKENYEQGHYIVVGGDYNHELPGTDADKFNTEPKPSWLKVMDAEFTGFNWFIDENIPTNRALDKSYVKGVNYISNIDGFLVSDNVKVTQTIVHDLNFENSDHNPVTIEFELNN